ncbi:MAG TPA: hypothetical protein VLT33_27650 [Labilithrix sp.]|nr:hypothetical protein [Labilithrix sp.]
MMIRCASAPELCDAGATDAPLELTEDDFLEARPRPARPPPRPRPVAPRASFATVPAEGGASSIAPLALDVAPLAQPLPRASFDSLPDADVERAAGVPRRALWQSALTFGGLAVVAALSLLSVVALQSPPPTRALAVTTPRAASVIGAREAVFVPVSTAPGKALATDVEEPSTPRGSARFRRSSIAVTSQPPQTGVLRLAPSVKGVLVDGTPHRVERGLVTLPCGAHRVKTSSQPARVVVIACPGKTAL